MTHFKKRLRPVHEKAHISIPNFRFGRPECLLARFSISSKATLWSCMMTIVWPSTVTELSDPYRSLCFSQCRYSGIPGGGKSVILPNNGRTFGPGGSGIVFLWRLSQNHASMAGMSIKTVLTVGLKAIITTAFSAQLCESRMLCSDTTLVEARLELRKVYYTMSVINS